jgi:hypothetical protein
MNNNSPYKDTVILQKDALTSMLVSIKKYPVAGKKTGIRLCPNENGTKL